MSRILSWAWLNVILLRNYTTKRKRSNNALMEKLNQADNLVFLPFLDLNDDQLAKIIIVAMKRSKWTVLHLNHNQITNVGVRYLCQTILANPYYLRNYRNITLKEQNYQVGYQQTVTKN